MSTLARAEFQIVAWEEAPYQEIEGGGKLTRASVTKYYTGGIEGEGKLVYLMAYQPDGTASFVGLELVTGAVGSQSGTFVFRHEGTFDGAAAKGPWTVVEGSGTGGLRGLRGTVQFAAGHGKSYPIQFDYTID